MLSRLKVLGFAAVLFVPLPSPAQTPEQVAEYNAVLQQYLQVRSTLSAGERAEVDKLLGSVRATYGLDRQNALKPLSPRRRVGSLSANPYLSGSTTNPASRYDGQSPANRYSTYGSPYSPQGARNPYTTGGLEIYGDDGTYLGRLNANSYDPESVANPYGRYGSSFSPESINNPYGRFGSPYSGSSARNPYATSPPGLYTPSTSLPTLPPLGTLPTIPPIRPPGG